MFGDMDSDDTDDEEAEIIEVRCCPTPPNAKPVSNLNTEPVLNRASRPVSLARRRSWR